jgi:hypothetical protein
MSTATNAPELCWKVNKQLSPVFQSEVYDWLCKRERGHEGECCPFYMKSWKEVRADSEKPSK